MLPLILNLVGILAGLGLFFFAGETTTYVAPMALWTIFTLAYYSLVRAKKPGFLIWFAISYSALFLLFPAIKPLLQVVVRIDPGIFVKYAFLAITGCHLFLMGYDFGGLGGREEKWDGQFTVDIAAFYRVLLFLLLLNLLGLSLKIFSAGSLQAVIRASRIELKTEHGFLNNLSLYLASIGAMFFPLLAALIFRKRKLAVFAIALFVLLDSLFLIVFRTRTPVLMHLTGVMMGWVLIGPRIDWGVPVVRGSGSPIRRVLASVLILLLVGISGLLIRTMRGQFNSQEGRENLHVDLWAAVALGFQGGDLNYSLPVMTVIEKIPSQYEFLHGQSYYRLLFTGVPRTVWANKPHNSGIIFAQIISPGSHEVQTIPAGVIGDLYANFSFWGIMGMFFFGWLFRLLDRGGGLSAALFFSVSFAMVFHFTRGSFTNPVVVLIIYWGIANLMERYLKPNRIEATF